MIGRSYFIRQATSLLKLAKSIKNPELAAVLVDKAANLTAKIDETPKPPDQNLKAPDVETTA